ncbi:hypothetical protein F5Y16DRAFT_29118 [Xylariaceae sp. FL0255]|nr:hypothetical protein F5Y16DRAFT_29118 [Xylariaceae sp. FL0255]
MGVNTAVAMSTNRPSSGWATANDWAAHRSLITSLYREENKTLKETMQVMEEEHNFFATVRMYKARFQQWGIEKKIKAEDAVEIFRRQTARAKEGKETVAYVRGRKINPDRLQRYRYRAAAVVSEQILLAEKELNEITPSSFGSSSSHVICRTPSPEPSIAPSLQDPPEVRIPRECMQILQNYLAGGFQDGAWVVAEAPKHRADTHDAFTWAHYLATSQGLIAHNRTREGFHLLGICFEVYKLALQQPDSFFWLATYKAALVLGHRDRRLAEAFMSYASSLTSVILPRSHPFNLVWSRLMITGFPGLQQHAAAMFESFLNTWRQHAGTQDAGEEVLLQMAFVYIQLQASGMISYALFKEILEPVGELLSDTIHWQFLLQEAKSRLGYLYLDQGRLKESEIVTEEIITWLDSRPESDYSHLRCKCLWAIFEIKQKQRATKEATEAGFSLVKLCHDIYGPVHLQTIDAMAALEKFLKQAGDTMLAGKMTSLFNKRWAVFRDMGHGNNGYPHEIELPWFHRAIELDETEWRIQQAIDLFDQLMIKDTDT